MFSSAKCYFLFIQCILIIHRSHFHPLAEHRVFNVRETEHLWGMDKSRRQELSDAYVRNTDGAILIVDETGSTVSKIGLSYNIDWTATGPVVFESYHILNYTETSIDWRCADSLATVTWTRMDPMDALLRYYSKSMIKKKTRLGIILEEWLRSYSLKYMWSPRKTVSRKSAQVQWYLCQSTFNPLMKIKKLPLSQLGGHVVREYRKSLRQRN